MGSIMSVNGLSKSHEIPMNTEICGVIALSWPYSFLAEELTLLLVEEDFRLRPRGGEIRVRFEGDAAAGIWQEHLNIGEKVQLDLTGAQWHPRIWKTSNTDFAKPKMDLALSKPLLVRRKELTKEVVIVQKHSHSLDSRDQKLKVL